MHLATWFYDVAYLGGSEDRSHRREDRSHRCEIDPHRYHRGRVVRAFMACRARASIAAISASTRFFASGVNFKPSTLFPRRAPRRSSLSVLSCRWRAERLLTYSVRSVSGATDPMPARRMSLERTAHLDPFSAPDDLLSLGRHAAIALRISLSPSRPSISGNELARSNWINCKCSFQSASRQLVSASIDAACSTSAISRSLCRSGLPENDLHHSRRLLTCGATAFSVVLSIGAAGLPA